MELFLQLIDIFRHLDVHLAKMAADYGTWIYAILFLVIFCETGLVVTPFLPGDSLLFAAGALCATSGGDGMSIVILIPLLITAAFVGDQCNYWVGHLIGPKFLRGEKIKFVKRKHIEKTERFYETYGGKTVIMARFVPIVRTFAPFVAGIGSMRYPRFVSFSIVGGILWVSICSLAGFFFGELELVKKNFELVVLAIIFVSVLPILIEMLKAWRAGKKEA
jgi:membrane-associated protein